MKWIRGWRALTLAAVAIAGAQAQEALPLQKTQDSQNSAIREIPGRRLWQLSVVTLSAANVLDVHSSLGKHELNSTLAGPSGRFGTRGALIKGGLQGGLLGFEYLMIRRYSHGLQDISSRSKLYRTLSILNFAAAGVISGVAAHNYTIARPQQ